MKLNNDFTICDFIEYQKSKDQLIDELSRYISFLKESKRYINTEFEVQI